MNNNNDDNNNSNNNNNKNNPHQERYARPAMEYGNDKYGLVKCRVRSYGHDIIAHRGGGVIKLVRGNSFGLKGTPSRVMVITDQSTVMPLGTNSGFSTSNPQTNITQQMMRRRTDSDANVPRRISR
eukprot:2521106-Amphidinium_carterae.1